MRRLARLLARVGAEAGYTLMELLVVMAILFVVLTGLVTAFVSGANAELDLNNRFQAQQQARLALDRIRREAHCASTVTIAADSVTFTLPTQAPLCPTGSGSVVWCTAPVAALRFELYRTTTGACTSGVRWADYLTTGAVFSAPQATGSLKKVGVSFPVDLKPGDAIGAYKLADEVVLRNSARA